MVFDTSYSLCTRWGARPGDEVVDAWRAKWILHSWSADPLARSDLRRALFELGVLGGHDEPANVAEVATHALERGTLRVLSHPRPKPILVGVDEPEESASEPPPAQTHDLNFTFQYCDGTPAAGLAYRFFDLDENCTEDQLGDDAVIDKHNVPEGTYRVELKEVLAVRWAERKVDCGAEVALVAFVSGFDDGTAAKVRIFREHQERDDEVVDTFDATVSEGRVECSFAYDHTKNEVRAAQQGILRLVAEVSLEEGAHWSKTVEPLAVQLKTMQKVAWTSRRVHPAFDAELTVSTAGYPDGTEVSFELFAHHLVAGPTSLTTVTAPLAGGLATTHFAFMPSEDPAAADFESGRIQHGGEYHVLVTIEGDVERTTRSPVLHCDPRPATPTRGGTP